MTKRSFGYLFLAVTAVAVAAVPAAATDVQTSLKLVGAFDTGFNPVAVSAAAIPVDQPLVLQVGAYGKLTNPAGAAGIGAFSLDVTGVDAGLAAIYPPTVFPQHDTNGALPGGLEGIWNAAAFDTADDLVLVTGAIFPTTNGFRSNLGAGSVADVGAYGVELFSFYLLSQQKPGSMSLGLGQHGLASPWGFLMGTLIRNHDPGTDSSVDTGLALTFVPEPTTLCLLALAGVAAWRRRK